ncbi:smc-4, partial [Pristionchus pacificus]
GMARGKNARDSDSVSDPSEGEMDSDDSLMRGRPPKKKVARKEQPKKKISPKRKASPRKQKHVEEEVSVVSNQLEEDEDDEQRGLIVDYDEEDLLNLQVPDAPKPCMATEGGERLIITDIVVENFKSYHGVRRIGPFHHSFTSIIGPNGSGKSNVIDAMLFVFGYKASKIRSKKVSVLIHSSAGKENNTFCSVKISFQKIIDKEEGKFDVVENSSFNVARTAYLNNSSEYRMDGTRTSFKEVAARLKEAGIDLIHNRFLILQGEVEQIALMKPKSEKESGGDDGMLEYLEDIIGSSRYKAPIDKLAIKLDKLQSEKSHQITRVETARTAKDGLVEPVKKTINYLTMQNKLSAINCKQYLFQKYKAQDEADSTKEKQLQVEEDLQTVTTKLDGVIEQLSEKRAAIEDMTGKAAEKQAQIHNKANELELLTQKDKKRQNDLIRVDNELKRLMAEVKKEKEKLEEATKAPMEARAKMEQLDIQLNEYKDELTTAQEMFDENFPKYNKKTEADRAKKAKLEEEYSDIAAKLADAQAKVKLADSSLRNMMEDYEKKKKQLSDLEESLKGNKEKLEKDRLALSEIRASIALHTEETRKSRVEMDEINERSTAIKTRLNELAPILVVTEKQQEAQAKRNSSKITDCFEKAVKKGLMRGYIGRLGDLGSIDPVYDRAISNNFGGPLDMYLVEDGRTAAEGIELLKQINSRAYFLSLDRQQKSWGQIEKLEKEAKMGGPSRLFNLIRCDEKYKPAFFYAVKYTYVVKTIDEAHGLYRKLLAEGRREAIVTMDGNQITGKGAFIGGGHAKEGKMGTAKVVRRISTAAEDAAHAQKVEQARTEKQALDTELSTNLARYHELERQLFSAAERSKSESSAREIERQIKSTEERIRVQEAQRTERVREMDKARVDEKELKVKQEELDRLTKERDDATTASNEFKTKIKEIDNDMAKIYNKLVKPHEMTLTSARESIEKAELDRAKQQAIINGGDRNIEKQRKRVSDVAKDADQKRTKGSTLKNEEDTFMKNKTEKENELREFEAALKSIDRKLKAAREGTSELDMEEVRLEKEKKLLAETLREMRAKTKVLLRAVEEYSAKAADLTLHNLSDLLAGIPPEDIQGLEFNMDDDEEQESEAEDEASSRKKSKKHKKKKSVDESPRKKRKMTVDEEGEGEGAVPMEEGVNEEMEEGEQRNGDVQMEEEDGAAGTVPAEAGLSAEKEPVADNEEAPVETEAQRAARKLQEKRDKKAAREQDLKNGVMPNWSRKYIKRRDQGAMAEAVERLEKSLAASKKNLLPHVLEDYKSKMERFRKESDLLSIVKDKHDAHRVKLEGLKKLRLAEFMGGFLSISTALRELYQMITLGGDAALEVKDNMDPFIEGVQFMVRPPKKSWKQIANLSGGEKTLSSLALVFALHKYRPTPLYVMDEIDAALDFRNVSIIGHYIKDRTKNAQFIIISLRNNMFELADRLIGIYKVHDSTRNVVVDPKRVLEETKELRSGLNKVRMLMENNKILTGVGI